MTGILLAQQSLVLFVFFDRGGDRPQTARILLEFNTVA